MSKFHTPVLVDRVIEYLKVQGGWFIDCNLGGGGHTQEILKRGGKILGLDLDLEAIEEVAKNHQLNVQNGVAISDNLILVRDNFSNILRITSALKIEHIKGVLFDLGISSHQLDKGERGFSFNTEAPLDMRMDQDQPVSAKDLINGLHEEELAELFFKLGEEYESRKIAKKIVEERQKSTIDTTTELARIVSSAKRRSGKTHPATKVFQALRIAVNDELNNLKEALPQALEVLDKGGRLVVISFHSLEDRIVKDFFTQKREQNLVKILTEKPISPSESEVEINPRGRSAKLRAAEKL